MAKTVTPFDAIFEPALVTEMYQFGDGSTITAVVGDKKNSTGNSFSEPVGQTDKKFKVNLKVENLKMLPGDYTVSISSKKISRFQGSGDLVYYVAVEADSTFDF